MRLVIRNRRSLLNSSETLTLTAPSTAGTYYYGACVDAVTDESDTTNNCSDAQPCPRPAAPRWRRALAVLALILAPWLAAPTAQAQTGPILISGAGQGAS